MWISLPYLFAVLACLYGPFLGDLWAGTKSLILFNAGIPLALVTAGQIAFHERLSKVRAWGALLSVSWLCGCALICVPAVWPDDLVRQAVVVGGLLVLASIGVILGTILGALRDPTLHPVVRALYGVTTLGVGVVFLRGGLRMIASTDGGPVAVTTESVELFRRVVSSLAAFVILAGIVEWGIARRRPTSGIWTPPVKRRA